MDNIIEIAADWFEKYLAVGNTIDDWLRDSKVVNSGRSKFLSDMERETANNMEQFSLEKYLKDPDRKVVTRDGRDVRIVCTDRKKTAHSPVFALVSTESLGVLRFMYYENGRISIYKETALDLFFAPTTKTGWATIALLESGEPIVGMKVYETRQEAEEADKAEKQGCDKKHPKYYVPYGVAKVEWEE